MLLVIVNDWIQGVKDSVAQAGIGFMMAPIYHPAMKIVRPIRKKLKVKTVFNILGPMLNPARVPFAVIGVYKEDLVIFKLPIILFDKTLEYMAIRILYTSILSIEVLMLLFFSALASSS